MTDLPEAEGQNRAEIEIEYKTANTDELERNELTMEETPQEQRTRTGRFGTGFLAGFLTALVCVIVLFLGMILAETGILKKEKEVERAADASILTDTETLVQLTEIQELIEEHYLDEVNGEQLYEYLFKGVAVGLDDPYANYYSEAELQSVLDSSRGEYYGIGATLSINTVTGEICAIQIYEGSPAEAGGLQEGDIFQYVNDTSVAGMDLTELVSMIKSMEEAFVVGVYRPETEEELELTLTCGEVEISHVEYRMLEAQTGYIQITEFTETAVTQFTEAVDDLKGQGMEALVVDLRNNPGGLLSSVCDILEEVLPEGLIVYTEDKAGNREEYECDGRRSVTCEIAVLVNGYSASASEIFAGAVQDYELGPIVGTQTYGKGVVQKTYPLSDGGAFKMTVEKYFTPKGQDIDGNGITPDIIIEETAADENAFSEAAEGTEPDDTEMEDDPVLQAALTALNSGEWSAWQTAE